MACAGVIMPASRGPGRTGPHLPGPTAPRPTTGGARPRTRDLVMAPPTETPLRNRRSGAVREIVTTAGGCVKRNLSVLPRRRRAGDLRQARPDRLGVALRDLDEALDVSRAGPPPPGHPRVKGSWTHVQLTGELRSGQCQDADESLHRGACRSWSMHGIHLRRRVRSPAISTLPGPRSLGGDGVCILRTERRRAGIRRAFPAPRGEECL